MVRSMKGHRLERQFGFVVGGVFLALGLWTLWRGSWPLPVSRTVAAGGLLLVLLAATMPAWLVYPRKAWMALAELLGFVSTRVILGAVFFLVVLPLGLVMRWTGWDPLVSRRQPGQSYWVGYPARQANPKHFEQMF
jgi:hypothetical protein